MTLQPYMDQYGLKRCQSSKTVMNTDDVGICLPYSQHNNESDLFCSTLMIPKMSNDDNKD